MPRIFSAVYKPFTYDELAKPLQQATEAHLKAEQVYADTMLTVDQLKQRAEDELKTNRDSRWARNVLDYTK